MPVRSCLSRRSSNPDHSALVFEATPGYNVSTCWNDVPVCGTDHVPKVERSVETRSTSIEKAIEVCEALSQAPRGLSVAELHRLLKQPRSTIHRLLAVLKRRGYVQQDEDSARYRLTLKMLDLSFRLLGRSELRLHAYPVLREYVLRTGLRAFLAASGDGEVTYLWTTEPDAVAMHTTYGKAMPGHCVLYLFGGVGASPELPAARTSARRCSHRDVGAVRGRPSGSAPRVHVRSCRRLHRTRSGPGWRIRTRRDRRRAGARPPAGCGRTRAPRVAAAWSHDVPGADGDRVKPALAGNPQPVARSPIVGASYGVHHH